MSTNFDLSVLDKFIGCEVKVNKEELNVSKEPDDDIAELPKVFHYTLDANNPVIDKIKSLTADFRLRIWLPNTVGTMDARRDRINVKFNQTNDVFTIKSFNIG